MNEVNFSEVNFNVEKIDGGFIVQTSNYTGGSRKIVRKLSEVISLLKIAMIDEVTE